MRLDKFLVKCNIGSRTEVKTYIKKGFVKIGEETAKKPETDIDEINDEVFFKGEKLMFKEFFYIILNKPADVVTATTDNHDKTVMDLINPLPAKDLSPVGRLDKDTTGLLLITNNGELSHNLLSPKKHVDKTYLVKPDHELSKEDLKSLESGVDIGDNKPTLPAKVTLNDDGTLLLTIHEGRFHQVKRMLEAVGNRVIALKRVSFGGLYLPDDLKEGDWRELTEDEIQKIILR
jgi:16S rRNA pseudouridine516 synthase